MSQEITIFDRILAKEIPCQSVYEDEVVLAFKDISPQAPVHVLVIPKKKRVDFSEFCERSAAMDIGLFFQKVAHVAKTLGLEEGGYRVVINNGREAGQTVSYLHAHIMGGNKLKMMG